MKRQARTAVSSISVCIKIKLVLQSDMEHSQLRRCFVMGIFFFRWLGYVVARFTSETWYAAWTGLLFTFRSHKSFTFVKMAKKHWGTLTLLHSERPKSYTYCTQKDQNCILNPVALRKAKIVYLTLLHSERPKLYTILAFLSAVG